MLLVGLVILIVAIAGGVFFVLRRPSPKPTATPSVNQSEPAAVQPASGQPQDEIGSLTVAAPSFDIPSSSALPNLDVSALNLTSANLPSKGIYKDFSVNTDTAYSYKMDIAVPAINITVPDLPAAGTTGGTIGGTVGGSTGNTGSSGASQGAVTPANCAQFSAMPSAQYCTSVPDANGRTLCSQCKAAGL